MKTRLTRVKERLEDIQDMFFELETLRVNAYTQGYNDGANSCPECKAREQHGTDPQTIKKVVEEVRLEFPKEKKVVEYIKKIQ